MCDFGDVKDFIWFYLLFVWKLFTTSVYGEIHEGGFTPFVEDDEEEAQQTPQNNEQGIPFLHEDDGIELGNINRGGHYQPHDANGPILAVQGAVPAVPAINNRQRRGSSNTEQYVKVHPTLRTDLGSKPLKNDSFRAYVVNLLAMNASSVYQIIFLVKSLYSGCFETNHLTDWQTDLVILFYVGQVLASGIMFGHWFNCYKITEQEWLHLRRYQYFHTAIRIANFLFIYGLINSEDVKTGGPTNSGATRFFMKFLLWADVAELFCAHLAMATQLVKSQMYKSWRNSLKKSKFKLQTIFLNTQLTIVLGSVTLEFIVYLNICKFGTLAMPWPAYLWGSLSLFIGLLRALQLYNNEVTIVTFCFVCCLVKFSIMFVYLLYISCDNAQNADKPL